MTEFEKIATDCRAAADYYQDHPGHAGPETMIDIYRTMQRMAEMIHKFNIAMARSATTDSSS